MMKNTLLHQNGLFVGLCARVALLQEDLEKVKAAYRGYLAKFRRDLRDPFAPRGGSAGARQRFLEDAPQQERSVALSSQPDPPSAVKPATYGSLFAGAPLGAAASTTAPQAAQIGGRPSAFSQPVPSFLQTPNAYASSQQQQQQQQQQGRR